MKSKIISISGTSGAGKTFLVDKIIKQYPSITEIAGITTRPMRPGEVQGQSSHFITLDEFRQLEEAGELMLVKEFFGNKYAWFKKDLINGENVRIMNISYKSIAELKQNKLNLFSVFIRPDSEEKLKEMLRQRIVSDEEYEKRLKDYYESERFLQESPQDFDLIFTNHYDEKSEQELIALISEMLHISAPSTDSAKDLMELLAEDARLSRQDEITSMLLEGRHMEEIRVEE